MDDVTSTMVSLHQKHSYPAYLFDCDALIERVKAIQAALPDNCTLCYAVKANPFLVRTLSATPSLKFEACSRGELELCLADGVLPERIVFSGVMKSADDIRRALEVGVGTITLESLEHARLLLEQSASLKEHTTVILRFSSGSQFGMSEGDFEKCVALLSDISRIKVAGVHYFTGTQKHLKKISEEIAMICAFVRAHNFAMVEYGAGSYYDYYGDSEHSPSSQGEAEAIHEIKELSSLIKVQDIDQWVIELGRYIAAPVGYYVTRIMDVKEQFVICDGGINHVNYYGSMIGMKKPRVMHIRQGETNGGRAAGSVQKYTVCGSLCTFNDVLLRAVSLDSPAIGDYLIFNDIGAYSITECIYLFLSHSTPAVYEKSGGAVRIRREPMETYKINH